MTSTAAQTSTRPARELKIGDRISTGRHGRRYTVHAINRLSIPGSVMVTALPDDAAAQIMRASFANDQPLVIEVA